MRARFWIPVAIVALVGLGVWWWLDTYERAPGKQWVGPSGEARRNPFLAAERFAARMGMAGTAQLRSLPELDALKPGGVLLVPNRRQALDAPRAGRILNWVNAGGHLIAEAEFPGVADPLFDALATKREMASDVPTKPLRAGKFAVTFFDPMRLRSEQAGEPLLRVGDKLLSYRRGKGMVTLATSLNFARNGAIGQHDNAAFFWSLATLTPAAQLHVFFRPERLSLWRFLAANAAPVLVAAGALLLLWLWRIMPRFGPVAPDLPPARRRLLDHLRASGRYYWAKGLRSRLVVAARDEALRRLSRAQPDFAGASQKERVKRLSHLIGVSEEEAGRFLAAAGQMRGADFIRITQHAQRVHSALEKGDK
ncbi:MAG: DUF4350 domain-containing protein [Betaproteobacteria bacterium]